jgi:hypothetical protein
VAKLPCPLPSDTKYRVFVLAALRLYDLADEARYADIVTRFAERSSEFFKGVVRILGVPPSAFTKRAYRLADNVWQ